MNEKSSLFRFVVLAVLLLIPPWILSARNLAEIKRSGVIYAAVTEISETDINHILAQEFAKQLGVKLIKVPVSWQSVFTRDGTLPENLETNPNLQFTPDALKKADFVCTSLTILEWRKKLYQFVETFKNTSVLVVPSRYQNVGKFEDLKNMTIGFLENSFYTTSVNQIDKKIGGGIRTHEFDSEENSLNALKAGTIDGIVLDSDLALQFIAKNKNRFKFAFPINSLSKSGWGLEKNNLELLQEFEGFFKRIRNNGKLNQIFKKNLGLSHTSFTKLVTSYSDLFLEKEINKRDLDEILLSNKLVIALRDRDFVYHPTGQKQFHHLLAEAFARELGVELKIVITPNFSKYWENKNQRIVKEAKYTPPWFQKFDIACDTMIQQGWQDNKAEIIPFLPEVSIVTARKETEISSIIDLKKLRGIVIKGSSYVSELKANGIHNFYHQDMDEMIPAVLNQQADYTVLSNAIYLLPRYPSLEAKIVLGEVKRMGWAIKRNQPKLKRRLIAFLQKAKRDGLIDQLYYQQTGMTLKESESFLNIIHDKSQTGQLPFVYYGLNDGLPQEDILSIFQDKDNFMWFGTHSGAVKYTGKEMIIFNTDKGLNNNSVFDIKQDKDGIIYFATSKGISILNNQRITTIFKNNQFKKIYIDGQNNKWFIGDNGVYQLTRENNRQYLNEKVPDLPRKIRSLVWDNKGKQLYLTSSKGLFSIDQQYNLKKRMHGSFYAIYLDAKNLLWVSKDSGLYVTNIQDFSQGVLGKKLNEVLGISDKPIKQIIHTRNSSFWLISDEKVFQVITTDHKAIVWDKKIGLINNHINTFLQDKEDNLWFGLAGGIQKLTNRSLRLFFPNLINDVIYGIVRDGQNRIWISSESDVYYFKNRLVPFGAFSEFNHKKHIVLIRSNGNLMLVSTSGIYEFDVNTLRLVQKRTFSEDLPNLKGAFVSSKDEIFLLTGRTGIVYYLKDLQARLIPIENSATTLIFQLTEYNNRVYGGNSSGLVVFEDQTFKRYKDLDTTVWSLYNDGKKLWIGTEDGLWLMQDNQREFKYLELTTSGKVINAITSSRSDDHLWLGTNKGVSYFDKSAKTIDFTIDARDGLSGNEVTINGLLLDTDNILWLGTYHGVSLFDMKKRNTIKHAPVTHLERIYLNGKVSSHLKNESKHFHRVELDSKENNLVFEINGLSYKDEKSIEYEYFLRGLKNDFSQTSTRENKAYYQNLTPGNYDFVYRSKGKDGIWSNYQLFRFEILKPFWQTIWFYVSGVLLIILLLFLITRFRTRAWRIRNLQLENEVKKRTIEIRSTNECLTRSNSELSNLTYELSLINEQLNQKNQQIVSSIQYASMIQKSILPDTESMNRVLGDHLLFWKPRHIVGGDFYWLKETMDAFYIAVVDCTGHGVPGAFMSMTANSILNRIVEEYDLKDPAIVLRHLNKILRQTLSHDRMDRSLADDGLDIGLCSYSFKDQKLTYSGARISLFCLQQNKLVEFKGDRQSIGYQKSNENFNFTNHEFPLNSHTTFYMVTDGMIDQSGGVKGFAFGKRRLKELILKKASLSLTDQTIEFEDRLSLYRGQHNQKDDITMLGFKMPFPKRVPSSED